MYMYMDMFRFIWSEIWVSKGCSFGLLVMNRRNQPLWGG